MQAAATIYKKEVKKELKGEKVKEAVETDLTPELRPSFLPNEQHVPYLSPTQTAHYVREKTTEKIEVTYLTSHNPENLNSPRSGEDTLEPIKNNGSPIKRFPVGDNLDKLLESKIP